MKLTFLGAAHEVTGSCYYLEAAGKKFLVDCGMEQGPNIYENKPIPVPAAELDFVLLTHAHIDHSGNLPAFTPTDSGGPVYTTEATADLCDIYAPRQRPHSDDGGGMAHQEKPPGREAGSHSALHHGGRPGADPASGGLPL